MDLSISRRLVKRLISFEPFSPASPNDPPGVRIHKVTAGLSIATRRLFSIRLNVDDYWVRYEKLKPV